MKPELKALSLSNRMHYLDFNPQITDELKEMKAFLDACHLTDEGYKYTAERIAQYCIENNICAPL